MVPQSPAHLDRWQQTRLQARYMGTARAQRATLCNNYGLEGAAFFLQLVAVTASICPPRGEKAIAVTKIKSISGPVQPLHDGRSSTATGVRHQFRNDVEPCNNASAARNTPETLPCEDTVPVFSDPRIAQIGIGVGIPMQQLR